MECGEHFGEALAGAGELVGSGLRGCRAAARNPTGQPTAALRFPRAASSSASADSYRVLALDVSRIASRDHAERLSSIVAPSSACASPYARFNAFTRRCCALISPRTLAAVGVGSSLPSRRARLSASSSFRSAAPSCASSGARSCRAFAWAPAAFSILSCACRKGFQRGRGRSGSRCGRLRGLLHLPAGTEGLLRGTRLLAPRSTLARVVHRQRCDDLVVPVAANQPASVCVRCRRLESARGGV